MKLFEVLETQDYQTAYYDPAADVANVKRLTGTRTPKLTLRHLNRLKRIRELDKLQGLKREDLLGVMYAIPDENAGMGGGMGGMPSGF